MASKLFHAVVAFGISLGSTACGGRIDGGSLPEPGPDDAGAPDDAQADAPIPKPPPPEAGPPDASPDALPDAPHDAPSDAIVEAFCDATWPITKAGREVCGPADGCVEIEAPFCYGPAGNGGCKIYPLKCEGSEWHCMGGAPSSQPEPCP